MLTKGWRWTAGNYLYCPKHHVHATVFLGGGYNDPHWRGRILGQGQSSCWTVDYQTREDAIKDMEFISKEFCQ